MPILLLFFGLTATTLIATIGSARGRAWGPILIAMYAFGMLVWMSSMTATLEVWIWIALVGTGGLALVAVPGLALTPASHIGGPATARDLSKVVATIAGMAATLSAALLTLLGISIASWGVPFIY